MSSIKTYIDDSSDEKMLDLEKNNLIFFAIVGIKDPLREEVPIAVEKCIDAGITVRMITGDNIETATAIAIDAGIITKDQSLDKDVVMMGRDLIKRIEYEEVKEKSGKTLIKIKNTKELKIIIKKLKVVARSAPSDKFLLVTGLKHCGKVVAVTGDGPNDIAALKAADVGIGMGSGSEAAKESSKIILLDDNFASLIVAAQYGRNV